MRKFEDDFGWTARLDEFADGTVRVVVSAPEGTVISDRYYPDLDTAMVRFRRSYPRFQEVA